MTKKRLIVGISGADGVSLGVRLLEILGDMPEVETLLVMSRAAERNLMIERRISPEEVRALADRSYEPEDMTAEVASGSFWTDGMIVAPCSMRTLAAVAHGLADNLHQGGAARRPHATGDAREHHTHKEHAGRCRGRLRHRAAHADVLQPSAGDR